MANRHLSRSVVLQTLFEWDFRDFNTEQAQAALARNTQEFSPGVSRDQFAETLLSRVIEKQATIDTIIEKAAPEWPIERVSVIDRNILRIGICELLFAQRSEVPPKVAINEAVEIAKGFGGESSGKFANGVLGAIYKELGEPEKDQTTKGKGKPNWTDDPSKMPQETLVGSVVYARHENGISLALVHDVFGHWTLAKGHLQEEEGQKEAARRKIADELGIEAVIEDELGDNEYTASDPKRGKIRKKVQYFLARADHEPLTQGESQGLDDVRWFDIGEVLDLNFYEDIMPIVKKAVSKLQKNPNTQNSNQ